MILESPFHAVWQCLRGLGQDTGWCRSVTRPRAHLARRRKFFFFDRIREACSIVFVRMHSAHKIFVKHQGGERMAGGHTTNTRT